MGITVREEVVNRRHLLGAMLAGIASLPFNPLASILDRATKPRASDLSLVIPEILAEGLRALRETAVMPTLVNRGYVHQIWANGELIYGSSSGGTTIDVPIPKRIHEAP